VDDWAIQALMTSLEGKPAVPVLDCIHQGSRIAPPPMPMCAGRIAALSASCRCPPPRGRPEPMVKPCLDRTKGRPVAPRRALSWSTPDLLS